MNRKMNILIVDDDLMMAKTLCDIMKAKGYEAEIANSAKEALKKLEDNKFDCVLSDIKMPDINGLELYRILQERFAHIPVILMSAYSSDNLVDEALEEGVISVLTKPLDLNLILNFISLLQKEKTVAIIDDDSEFSSALTDLLTIRNYNIVQINDTQGICNSITDEADIILLDMKLGNTDGLNVLVKIREKNPSLPVILVTGYRDSMSEKIEKAIEIGAYTCFHKPFSIQELSDALVGQIYQILLNLCTNAGHAMKDTGGILEVSLSDTDVLSEDIPPYSDLKAGKYIKLSVKDTGYGMEKGVLERIFEPFFTTKKRGEGTGMGLSVVHGIIKNHGGEITVYSEPGKGSIFYILLPVSDNIETVKEDISSCPVTGKGRILFIDDERDIVDLTEKMLTKLGYSVTATTSSLEALEIFKSRSLEFDLIITDQTMPELTGINLAREIFNICQEMPVIICTGLMDVLSAGKYDKFCIKEVIEKPVSMKKLAETIKKVIGTTGELR